MVCNVAECLNEWPPICIKQAKPHKPTTSTMKNESKAIQNWLPTVWLNSSCAILMIFTLLNQAKAQLSNKECDCRSVFSELVIKLENNYVGLHLRKATIGSPFEEHKHFFYQKAQNTPIEECTALLQSFLSFFKDGHLFVSEYPHFSDDEKLTTQKFITNHKHKRTEVTLNSTPILGYWTDGQSKFLVAENPFFDLPYAYVAWVVAHADSSKIGDLKFAVNPVAQGWEGVYYTSNYQQRYTKIGSHNSHQLMAIWGGIYWGRIESISSELYDPLMPSFKQLDQKTVLLTLPSFMVDAAKLTKVLDDNRTVMANTQNLIIDIRGNNGGNGIYFPLLRYYYDHPYIQEQGWALTSTDNIQYFERFGKNPILNPYHSVVKSMKSGQKLLVDGPKFKPIELKKHKSKIEKVIILTDSSNISAAETFILFSKGISNKVVTIGTHTGGVVDYNNINMISVGCKKQGIQFGYPTYTFHRDVVNQGYNDTGIAPDILINSASENALQEALNYLKK